MTDEIKRSQGYSDKNTINPEKNVLLNNFNNITAIQDKILKRTRAYNEGVKSSDKPDQYKNYI